MFSEFPEAMVKRYERQRAARERRSAVRTMPKPPWFGSVPSGCCRWCGFSIDPAKEGRRKSWHHACLGDYWMHLQPSNSAPAIAAKQGHRCSGCRCELRAFQHKPAIVDLDALSVWDRKTYSPGLDEVLGPRALRRVAFSDGEGLICPVEFRLPRWRGQERDLYAGAWCEVEAGWIKWQVDHIVPLWSVDRTLPWVRLIKFWGPTNLQALCDRCHKAKSAKEATDRARGRRGLQLAV